MILHDQNPQSLARIILVPRSILTHLFETPEIPIIGFRAASRCHSGYGNVTVGKTFANAAGSWRCNAVRLTHARPCFWLLSGSLQFPFFVVQAIDSTAPCSSERRLELRPLQVSRSPSR